MNFLEALKTQIIVLDGAMGTMIQDLKLSDEDFGGSSFKMCSDLLNFSHPNEVKNLHLEYFKAGANAIETNTLGSSPLRMKEFDFQEIDTKAFRQIPYNLDLHNLSYEEIAYYCSRIGVEAGCKAREEYMATTAYDGRPLFITGSIGPSNWVLSSTHANLSKGTWDLIESNFFHQVLGLIDGGVDVLLYETQQDILEVKAAVAGGQRAMKEKKVKLPIMVQVTVDEFSKMQIFNTDIHAALTTVQDIGIDVFGINCSIGPDLMIPTVEKMSRFCKLPLSVIPNAGLPVSENGQTVYKVGPKPIADHLLMFVEKYGVNIIGGCCGTTPAHIRTISEYVRGKKPVPREIERGTYISGGQNAVLLDSSKNLIRIGERLNVRGSKKVREAVENEEQIINYDALEEVVNEQVKDLGVSLIDVCMDSNLVDTKTTLPSVVQHITTDFPGVLCLDSFDVAALEAAIKVYPGRPIINSISMEEYEKGVSKIDALVPLTKFHNPLYICLATGPKGPGLTAQEKYDLAQQIVENCAIHGVRPNQLLIDVNAFPIGAESVKGMNFSTESLNAIPLIKSIDSDLRVTIGVGNLTNGLAKKPYMRIVLTSVFLDEAYKKGLDAAIVNPHHYVPVESLDAHDYQLGLKIILERDMEAYEELEEIAQVKSGKTVKRRTSYEDLTLTAAICEKIKDGFKERSSGSFEIGEMIFKYQDKIVLQVKEAIKELMPLDLINDHLMVAMQELGDGFGRGEVSLPHLLKSADVMKQVMGFLEDYMKRISGVDVTEEISYKGTIVMGTVYQDVHSIGKDLAKTLFENYGYRVIDLGVQVPLESFISTAIQEKADAIGMSALLVQTSNHMITVAKMMKDAHLDLPVLVGGAPVNKRHAGYVSMWGQDDLEQIKPDVFYCPSVMEGVNLMKILQSDEKEDLVAKNKEELRQYYLRAKKQNEKIEELLATLPRRQIELENYCPPAALYGIESIQIPILDLPLETKTLYALNWKLGRRSSWESKGLSPENVDAMKNKWIEDSHQNKWIVPQGKVGLFPCQAEGDEVILFDPTDLQKEIARIDFTVVVGKGNQEIFSAAQFFLPRSSGKMDVIGLQISTGGQESPRKVEQFKKDGDTESALLLQGLSDRVAEDLASALHNRMRKQLGIGIKDGTRYSPAYPGLENVSINKVIYKLLNADELGIELTDAHEFFPTSTTAAVVCFNPEASYN
ncbi:MAG: homocysteine S-methyltransferase family protein [SAR324 cluster bacterium]|nr:homocysteine S-methyltransferase family protein [SAR324 cluster bacterium]